MIPALSPMSSPTWSKRRTEPMPCPSPKSSHAPGILPGCVMSCVASPLIAPIAWKSPRMTSWYGMPTVARTLVSGVGGAWAASGLPRSRPR